MRLFACITYQDGDDVRLNRAIELLENDQPALGVLSADYSLENARALARSGLDFIIVDMEHYPFDVERLRLFLLGMTDKRQIQEKGNLQMNVTPYQSTRFIPILTFPHRGGRDDVYLRVRLRTIRSPEAVRRRAPLPLDRHRWPVAAGPRLGRRSWRERLSCRRAN